MMNLAWLGLKKNAAIADEDITVKQHEADLDANLENLVERLKKKRYRTKRIRDVTYQRRMANGAPLAYRNWKTNYSSAVLP